MGKPTGFLEYERVDGACVPPLERIKNFHEFHSGLSTREQLQVPAVWPAACRSASPER